MFRLEISYSSLFTRGVAIGLTIRQDQNIDSYPTSPFFPQNDFTLPLAPIPHCPTPHPISTSNPLSMKDMKRQLAIETLQACGGNKSKAAKQLDITRYTLDRLLL